MRPAVKPTVLARAGRRCGLHGGQVTSVMGTVPAQASPQLLTAHQVPSWAATHVPTRPVSKQPLLGHETMLSHCKL